MIKILFLCQMALSLSAAGDPGPFSSDYLVLRSQNFDVVVRKSDLEIGHHYVKVLERSHRLLAGLFLHPPPRTTVVLNPWQDITNGQAGVVPYPLITTFGTLPDNFGSLSETADWSLELLAHEYAHILSLEPATGAMRAFRHIFGSIISPNVLLPRWWKEGLSVLVESAVSPSGGRLRSLWQEATIRSLVMSERWEQLDIAGANEFIPQWPDGHRPYLLGSVFFARAQELHGHGVIGKLTLAHSSEVPYFLANPARSVLGVNYQDFYREAMQETSRRAWEQIITLRQEKVSSFHELPSPPEEQHFSPAFSSDGKYLAFVRLNRKGSRSLVIKKRPAEGGSFRAATQETWPTTTKQTEIKESRDYDGPPSGGLMGLAWMNKRNILIYDQSDSVDPWRVSSDLWLLDVESGRKEQLTYGLNAREPAVSPDDQKIVFIRNHFHKQGLEILDLESRSVETLYLGNIDERLSNPIFLGKDKILVARAVNAEESLWTFEIPLREWKKVLPEHAKARFPILTKKGLLFASAPNRVFNAWLATTDLKSAYPLTNTLDMIASPTLDPVTGELWLVRMSEFGPRLAVTEPAAKGELRLPHVTPIFTPPPLTDTKETDSEPVKVEDYSPWPWLWPRYWIPFVGTSSSSGGAFFQILTSNADPLARHKYSLVLGHDTAVAQTSFEARYFNSNQPLEWGIELGRTARDLIYSPVIRDNRAVVFRYPLWHWKRHLWLTASTQHQTLSDKFSSQSQLGVSSGLRWAEVSKGGRQITPQEGSAWYVNINPWFAGREGGSWTQLQTGGSLYFSNFLPEWHSLLLRGQMSLTNGPLHSAFGESTVAFAPRNDFNQPLALLRGYRSGSLFGRNLLSTTSEWRFPLKEIWRGRGTVPVFLRRLHGALVSDAASADGFFFDPATKSFLETNIGFPYFSWGFEMHLETTVGYALPLNMILGFYDGSHAPASLSLSFQLGALF